MSPLHFACSNGNLEIVKLLLQNGHAWNVVDNEGNTAGEFARHKGHNLVYDLLVEEGCRTELILGIYSYNNLNLILKFITKVTLI
jgi:type IV protein arginine methyltransferase